MSSHQNKLGQLTGEGERLCSLRNVGSDMVRLRSNELKALWAHLIEAVALRKKHLLEAQAYYQFFSGTRVRLHCKRALVILLSVLVSDDELLWEVDR